MRLLQDPTLHFFLVWLGAPIFAIIGVSLDRPAYPVSTGLAGWLITFVLWNALGVRSVSHQWRALPRSSGARRPDLSRAFGAEMRLLVGVGLVTFLAAVAALIVSALLMVQITQALLH
ncbi:MAG: hypothetical protein NZM11_05175 [Anaerolineales bacterium]|nr:hypothetical protein [Anaerolineales bacterium]